MEFKKDRGLFSKTAVNTGRQPELDLAKAVIIFCFALIHCIIECTPEEGLNAGIPYLFDTVIGGPFSAPMFMFAMGIGMAYTKRRGALDYLRRGIRLGIVSFALNACRFLFPYLLGYLLTGASERFLTPLPYKLFGNDILQFASLSMLCMALFVHFSLSGSAMLLIALACSLLGTLLIGADTGIPAANVLLGHFIGTEDTAGLVMSDFPLLNWLIVPVSGYVFGGLLQHVRDKRRFYLWVSVLPLLIAVSYLPVGISHGIGMFGEGQNCYYHMTTPDMFISLCLTVGLLGVYAVLVRFVPEAVMRLVQEISRNINQIYCVHWVLVSLCASVALYVIRGTTILPPWGALLLGTAISLSSMGIAHMWRKTRFGKQRNL